MIAYYNETDQYAAAWLRELIADGQIALGDVDERSIIEVQVDDLRGYNQCHFFAGIGGWSYALRLASIADSEPIWTGSCPCQPLSGAGQRKGHADERHLWPAFHRLIAECSPPTVFGEQVASKDGREWLAGVRADLEALGYAVGAADLCAASVGAPHIRQRLYWMADAQGSDGRLSIRERRQNEAGSQSLRRGEISRLADTDGRIASDGDPQRSGQHGQQPQDGGAGGVGQPEIIEHNGTGDARTGRRQFADASFIRCLNDKSRRAKPGIFPLVDGLPRGVVPGGDPCSPDYANATAEARTMRLRGYGNAIVPQVAAEFIRCAWEAGPAARKHQRGET